MSSNKKNIIKTYFPIALLVGFVLLSVYVNNVIIKFRLHEFEGKLERLSEEQAEASSVNFLGRFQLIKSRVENKKSMNDVKNEIKFQMLDGDRLKSNVEYSLPERAVLSFVKGVRLLMGKTSDEKEDVNVEQNKSLELAIYYERKRNYHKAIEIYKKILLEYVPPSLRTNVLLHLGFCEGLIGQFKMAKRSLNKIINNPLSQTKNYWSVSKKLYREIDKLEKRTSFLLKQELGDLEKGKQLLMVGNAKVAEDFLEVFVEQKGMSEYEEMEGNYYLGRVKEDLGKSAEAVKYYQRVLIKKPASTWAKEANRRLYVMGKFYDKDKGLTKVAEHNIKLFGDTSFVKNLKQFEAKEGDALNQRVIEVEEGPVSLVDSSVIQALKIKGDTAIIIKEDIKEVSHPILDVLAKIFTSGSLDSIVEQEVLVEEPSVLAKSEKKSEITSVKLNPIRQKAIYAVIKARSFELIRVYTKWMKRGLIIDGSLKIEIVITSSGETESVKIVEAIGKLNFLKFQEEIIQKIENWKFRPTSEGSGNILLRFPIVFKTPREKVLGGLEL